MSNFIPEEKIEEIKNATDIVEVVSDYVLLKRTGKNYSGLCPFHAEKDPSFTVSPSKQIFHCFGCNTGGNVFNFLTKHDGLSFPEAVRLLGRRYGIEVPVRKMSPAMRAQISEREKLFAINRIAMEYYHWNIKHATFGSKAMDYLQCRALDTKMIDMFQLGYARDKWDGLRNYLQIKRVPTNLLDKSGLVIPRKSGSGFYDRFRERLIFPIHNPNKQVVGFGGRVLDTSLPKYLNSPETPVYSKSKNLYGMHLARNRCRETGILFIVEGYLDLIRMHQYDLKNVGATLGTALTPEHVGVIKGFAGKVILVFDGDDAGIQASLRSVGIFIEKGMEARVMLLPKGHDPDSYLQKFGREAFMKAAEVSRSIIMFILDTAQKKYGLSVDGKLRILDELKYPLATIQEKIAYDQYVKEVSERLGLKEYEINERVQQAAASMARSKRDASRPESRSRQLFDAGSDVSNLSGSTKISGTPLELQILGMIIQFPQILPEIVQNRVLDYFVTASLKSIAELILSQENKTHMSISNLISIVDDDEKRNILASLSIKEEQWNLRDCRKIITKFLQTSPLRPSISLTEQIRVAEKENDEARLIKLLQEKQRLAMVDEQQKHIE